MRAFAQFGNSLSLSRSLPLFLASRVIRFRFLLSFFLSRAPPTVRFTYGLFSILVCGGLEVGGGIGKGRGA